MLSLGGNQWPWPIGDTSSRSYLSLVECWWCVWTVDYSSSTLQGRTRESKDETRKIMVTTRSRNDKVISNCTFCQSWTRCGNQQEWWWNWERKGLFYMRFLHIYYLCFQQSTADIWGSISVLCSSTIWNSLLFIQIPKLQDKSSTKRNFCQTENGF